MTDHGNTIWDNIFEETNKNITGSSDGSHCHPATTFTQTPEEKNEQFEKLKKQILNMDDSFDMSFTPPDNHNITFSGKLMSKDDEEDDEDHCIVQVPEQELTNPSMTDHTEALINFKINKYTPDNLNGDSDMSITQEISKPIQESNVPVIKSKAYVHSCINVIADIKEKGKNWIEEKENIQIIPNVNDIYHIENQLKSDEKPNKTDMSITAAVPTANFQQNKRKTIIFDPESNEGNMSMTMIVQNKDKSTLLNPEIDEYNMSMTQAVPKIAPIQEPTKKSIFSEIKPEYFDKPHKNSLYNRSEIINESNLIQDPEIDDCNMSMTMAVPKIKQIEEPITNHNIVKENKRQTIVFDPESEDCNMSITMAVPQINNIEKPTDKNEILDKSSLVQTVDTNNLHQAKRKTIIFDPESEDCNMSITMAVPQINKINKSSLVQTFDTKINEESKRKTIVFNPDSEDSNMSMTMAISQINNINKSVLVEAIDTNDIQESKRKTIVFDPNSDDCNMSMTMAVPQINNIMNKSSLVETIDTNNIQESKRKTIVFDPNSEDCNMSMTIAVQQIHQNEKSIHKNDIVNKSSLINTIDTNNIQENKRKTIVFDPDSEDCNMSMTVAVPQINQNRESIHKHNMEAVDSNNIEECKQKSILFDHITKDCNISMTTTVPQNHQNEESIHNHDILNKSSLPHEIDTNIIQDSKRKTIVFDPESEDCNMSMTVAVPQIQHKYDILNESSLPHEIDTNVNQENKLKTTVFDPESEDCNMSMTTAVPQIKQNEEFIHEIDINKSTLLQAFNKNNIQESKQETIVFDPVTEDCNMSMTMAVQQIHQNEESGNKIDIVDKSSLVNAIDINNIQENKRKTIVFDPDSEDCNMSMTVAVPQINNINKSTLIETIDTNNIQESKRKTIVFDPESDDCNMSMTVAVPQINNINKSTLIESIDKNNIQESKQETIVFDSITEDCNMSMTIAVPQINNNEESILKHNIINKSTSIETIDTNNIQESKQKTIVFDPDTEDCNMSITVAVAQIDQNEECIQKHINKSTLVEAIDTNNQESKQKTIVFDPDSKDCNMSITAAIHQNSDINNVNNIKRNITIFDAEMNDCNMSITAAVPQSNQIQEHLNKSDIVEINDIEEIQTKSIQQNDPIEEHINKSETDYCNPQFVNNLNTTNKMIMMHSSPDSGIVMEELKRNQSMSCKFSRSIEQVLDCDDKTVNFSINPQMMIGHHKSIVNAPNLDNCEMMAVTANFSAMADKEFTFNNTLFNKCEISMPAVRLNNTKTFSFDPNDDMDMEISYFGGKDEGNKDKSVLDFKVEEHDDSVTIEVMDKSKDKDQKLDNSILKVKNDKTMLYDLKVDECDTSVTIEIVSNDELLKCVNVENLKESVVENCIEIVDEKQIVEDVDQNVQHVVENTKESIVDLIDDKQIVESDDVKMMDDNNESIKDLESRDDKGTEIDLVSNEVNKNNVSIEKDETLHHSIKKEYIIEEIDLVEDEMSFNIKKEVDTFIEDQNLIDESMDCLKNVQLSNSDKRKFSLSNLYDEEDDNLNNKRQRTSLEVCSWIKGIREEPQDEFMDETPTRHELDNFSNISLVNSSAENNRDSRDHFEESNYDITPSFSKSGLCNQSSESQMMTADVVMNVEEIRLIKYDPNDCVIGEFCESKWIFFLLNRTMKMEIEFESTEDKVIYNSTPVSSISIDSLSNKDDTKAHYMYIAMMNQLNSNNLNSLCPFGENVLSFLEYCVKTSQEIRKWERKMTYLNLKYGLEAREEMFTYRLSNLSSIWDVKIKMSNLPYASFEDVSFEICAGHSDLSEKDFMQVVKKIDHDTSYMINLLDNLQAFVKERTSLKS